MDAKARNCLLQHREALEKDIKTSYIMDHMISDNVLTVVEEEKVRSQVKPSEAFYTSLKFPVLSGLAPVSANLPYAISFFPDHSVSTSRCSNHDDTK